MRTRSQIRAYQHEYYELCIRVDREGMRQKWREARQRKKESNMKLIHVTYRATFKRLKAALFKFDGPINVEVIQQTNGMWVSRSPDTGVEFPFTECASAESAQKEATGRFHEQVSQWEIFGREPAPKGSKAPRPAARQLQQDEIQIRDGKVYFLETDDFTHVLDPNEAEPYTSHLRPAACGQFPKIKNFVSLKADTPPTCKQCAEVYKAHATTA